MRGYPGGRGMIWLLTRTRSTQGGQTYLNWLDRAGIRGHWVSPGEPWDVSRFDALLLPGGGDVNPSLFNEARSPATKDVHDDRDTMELRLIRAFFDAGKPVFGVCRGIQILNVACGGKLIQHIPAWLHDKEEHRQVDGKDSIHPVNFTGASRLAEALHCLTEVNSAHHQSVHPGALGKGLRVTAVTGSAIIEAVEGVDLPSTVLAVQWHPERLPPGHPGSADLIRLMMEMSR